MLTMAKGMPDAPGTDLLFAGPVLRSPTHPGRHGSQCRMEGLGMKGTLLQVSGS